MFHWPANTGTQGSPGFVKYKSMGQVAGMSEDTCTACKKNSYQDNQAHANTKCKHTPLEIIAAIFMHHTPPPSPHRDTHAYTHPHARARAYTHTPERKGERARARERKERKKGKGERTRGGERKRERERESARARASGKHIQREKEMHTHTYTSCAYNACTELYTLKCILVRTSIFRVYIPGSVLASSIHMYQQL